MKRLLYIPFCIAMLLCCKESDSMDAINTASFTTMQGKWYLTAVERNALNGQNVWEQITPGKADTLVFRPDGVVLDASG